MSDHFSNPNKETECGESILAYQPDIPIFSDKNHNFPVSQEDLEAIMDDDEGFENSLAVENQATKHSSDEPYSSYTEEKPYIEDDQTDTQEQIDDYFDEDEAYADSIRIPPETSFPNNEGEQSPSLPPRSRSKKQTSEAANVGIYTPLSLAQSLMQQRHFLLVNKAVYVYDGLVFTLLDDQELDRLIYQELRSAIEMEGKPGIITEIRKFIKLGDTVKNIPVDSDYIVFLNGSYNLQTDTFEKNAPDIFATSYLDFEYDENAHKCPYFKAFLNSVTGGDFNLKWLILQTMGYLLSCNNKAKKFFVIFGPGNSGKSLFLNILRSFYPSKFISSIELQDLGGKFSSGNLVDKRLNLGGDLPNKKLTSDVIKVVKGLTGGDLMTAERKYQQPFSYQPTCRLVFATNHNITLAYKDEQFLERLIIIPFMNPIPSDKQDRDLLEKMIPERAAIFNKALKAYKRLRDYNFVFPKVDDTRKYVNISSDNSYKDSLLEGAVMGFINERCVITGEKQDFVLVKDLYTAFSQYYQERYNICIEMDEFAKAFKAMTAEFDIEYKQKNIGRGYRGLYLYKSDDTV